MRRIVLAGLSLGVAGLLGSGCRPEGGNNNIIPTVDMAVPADFAGADLLGIDFATPVVRDMAVPKTFKLAELYKSGNDRQPVRVEGLVITGIARSLGTSNAGICQFEAFGQDPTAMEQPAGIRFYIRGQPCTPPMTDGGACRCDFPPNSNSPADLLADPTLLGTIVNVNGSWGIYTPQNPANSPPQHEIFVTSFEKVGAGGTITPVDIANTAPFAKNGMGFVQYENTLVRIKPAQPGTVGAVSNFGEFDFAGAWMLGRYRFFYERIDGGTFPSQGQMFSSITGVATLPFGGGVAPRVMADFAQ